MGGLDHHPDEYLSVVKLSIPTAHVTWWRGWYKRFTCCPPEEIDQSHTGEVVCVKSLHCGSVLDLPLLLQLEPLRF